MEYIEKGQALAAMSKHGITRNMRANKAVAALPAADVAPVVHGRWEWHGPCGDSNGKFWATCPVCKVRQRLGDYERFCPNCGAKMDKEVTK